MKQGSERSESAVSPATGPPPPPTLLLRLEPWPTVFFRNVRDLFWRPDSLAFPSSPPGEFWPDVFVASRPPWRRFLESACYHAVVVAALWASAQLLPSRPQIVLRPALRTADVLYSDDFLPPLDTGGQHPSLPRKGQPEYARQPIISVPPEPDNSHQTIVTPPQVKLTQDVPLPNVVAWSQRELPVAPVVSPPRSELRLPDLPASVIAPPPEVHATARPMPVAPEPAIVEPPPSIATASLRNFGDVNIAHSEVIAPAPQLPMSEQRTFAQAGQATLGGQAAVVPPPPAVESSGTSNAAGRLIALGIHPLPPSSTVQAPAGNRRGEFAATPEGTPGAPGTPDLAGDPHASETGVGGSDGGNGGHGGTAGNNGSALPPGLYVGRGSHLPDSPGAMGNGSTDGARGSSQPSSRENPRLLAEATPSRVTATPRHPAVPDDVPNETERQVFGIRRFYSMSLNMPNLNSGGGSWVIRFAELKQSEDRGVLMAPVATQKVDPAYPAALMRENVEGTVTLYAVIQSDGSVGDVRVLRSVDDRLDTYASTALSRWHFLPATKNGNPVAVEAVVMIPFRAIRRSLY